MTADGEVRIANACSHPDLFWALKGGGGGSFGVVTRLTLRVHPLPEDFGAVNMTIRAASTAAFRKLVGLIVDFCAERLFNPHWGEQIRFRPDNVLRIAMVFQGLTRGQAQAAWQPFLDSLDAARRRIQGRVLAAEDRLDVGARVLGADFLKRTLGFISRDDRPGAPPANLFWPGDEGQAGQFLHGYSSTWLPAALLQPARRAALADALFAASRHWGFSLHFNKGLAGAPAEALAARATRRRIRPCSMPSRSRSSAAKSSRRIRASPATSRTSLPRAGTRRRSAARRTSCASRARAGVVRLRERLLRGGLAARVLGRELCAAAGGEAQVRPGGALLRAPRRRQRAVERGWVHEDEPSALNVVSAR